MKSEIAPRPDRPYTGFDLRLANLAKFLIRHRRGAMVLQVIIFAACILGTASLRLHDDPNAWPPRNDRFVKLNDRITQHFGGGNSVSIEISVDNGTVFTLQNLHTIKDVTDAIYAIHGVIPYTVRSLSALEAKRFDLQNKGTPDETLVMAPLMPDFPRTEDEVRKIDAAAVDNPLVYGVLVSKDKKSALILADFRSAPIGGRLETTEPVAIYQAINEILHKYQRPGIELRAAGTPIIIGWVNSYGLRYVAAAFAVFILIIAVILWYGFRRLSGVLLPLRVSLLGALMGFGLYRLFFGPVLFSASALLAPFIVVAAGACHSVQFLSRFFYEEYPRLGDSEAAIVSTFVSRLRPMLVSLLCDVVPFAIMAIIPFENIRALGIVTGLGLISLTIDEFVLMIPALSAVAIRELQNPHVTVQKKGPGRLDLWLERVARRIIERPAIGIGIIAVSVIITAFLGRSILTAPVGQDNTYAIHNYLTRSWTRNPIYLMEREISSRFGGVYTMTILIDGLDPHGKALENPKVMSAIDQLAIFLRKQPSIGYVADVGFYIKTSREFVHSLDHSFFAIPDNRREIGEQLEAYTAVTPGGYDWLFDQSYNSAVIEAYASSTAPEKVRRLVGATQQEADRLFKGLPVEVGVAGGTVGIAEAFNRNIGYWLVMGALLGFLGTFLLSIPFIRSIALPALLIIPLALGTIAALGVMILCGIQLNSNATAALAIASGVGIDSEVYLLYRVREEYARLGDFKEALIQGFVKIRRALMVSNGALIFGCWVLSPIPLYVGYVGFGMGLVLAFCFVLSGVLSPILWSWFGKRAIVGDVTVSGHAQYELETAANG
jgi:uncharacterized protein